MLKAYKYRIYPNKEQQVLMEKHFGCVRFVYNWALALQNSYYIANGQSLSRSEIQSQLVAKKKDKDFAWLNEVNSQSLLNALLNVHTAFIHFFKGRTGHPRFKAKHYSARSYQNPQHSKVDFDKGVIDLPKLKGVKAKLSRPFEGKIKTVTVSKSATGKYYVSVLVESAQNAPIASTIEPDKTLGIDVGLIHLLNLSDGSKIDNPRFLKQARQRLKKAQRIFSRKQKDSLNRQQQRLVLARLHEKVKNQRLDLNHKLTHQLVCENQATSFAVEDLAVKNLVKNRKLARSISDAAWGQLITLLTYKSKWYGKNILTVDRFFASSKTCSHCHHHVKTLPLSVRSWRCEQCGTELDRDINASQNIRQQALADALGQSVV
ncbi:MAG: IS200/IS605 family element transposase accessory protein TnpB [Alcaligenaceae bacterium]|nr:IS200/IS605 family element transposase accessory protein TnpB [Alcaligenaceae bacterium]